MTDLKQRPTVVRKINLAPVGRPDWLLEPINKRRAQGVTSWGEPAEVKEQKASMSP